MNSFFLSSLSKAINTFLKLDSDSIHRLQKMHGKTITVELLPWHFIFQCLVTEQGITLIPGESALAETTIRGTPIQMLGVMAAKNERQRFFSEDLIIEGNAELGQQMADFFDDLRIDWEELLSRLVGDVSAHHIGDFFRHIKNWAHHAELTLSQDINEYVHEEAQWFPHIEALQTHMSDIDTLRMDVDRMEARINRIKNEVVS